MVGIMHNFDKMRLKCLLVSLFFKFTLVKKKNVCFQYIPSLQNGIWLMFQVNVDLRTDFCTRRKNPIGLWMFIVHSTAVTLWRKKSSSCEHLPCIGVSKCQHNVCIAPLTSCQSFVHCSLLSIKQIRWNPLEEITEWRQFHIQIS